MDWTIPFLIAFRLGLPSADPTTALLVAPMAAPEHLPQALPPDMARPPLERLPEALLRPEAVYPQQALEEGREASVLLEIGVTAQGEVMTVKVQESAGEDFDEAAVEAMRAGSRGRHTLRELGRAGRLPLRRPRRGRLDGDL